MRNIHQTRSASPPVRHLAKEIQVGLAPGTAACGASISTALTSYCYITDHLADSFTVARASTTLLMQAAFPDLPRTTLVAVEMHISLSYKGSASASTTLLSTDMLFAAAGHGWCARTPLLIIHLCVLNLALTILCSGPCCLSCHNSELHAWYLARHCTVK